MEPPRPNGPRPGPGQRTEPARSRSRYGTLAIRVQPGDAEILVDGQRWDHTPDTPRLSIELSEGRHVVEVRKDGFSTYREDVLIRNNRTLSINVALTRP
jgi:hypothetical protein